MKGDTPRGLQIRKNIISSITSGAWKTRFLVVYHKLICWKKIHSRSKSSPHVICIYRFMSHAVELSNGGRKSHPHYIFEMLRNQALLSCLSFDRDTLRTYEQSFYTAYRIPGAFYKRLGLLSSLQGGVY